jgi:hypothetical protein
MKRLIALVSVVLFAPAFAADAPKPAAALDAKPAVHRYLIERTFPPGALAGLDARNQAEGQREQCFGGRALGGVLRQCGQNENLLHLRGAQRGGGPQGRPAQQAAR